MVARPTSVSVDVGRVNIPVLLIVDMIGDVSVLLVSVCAEVRFTSDVLTVMAEAVFSNVSAAIVLVDDGADVSFKLARDRFPIDMVPAESELVAITPAVRVPTSIVFAVISPWLIVDVVLGSKPLIDDYFSPDYISRYIYFDDLK